MKKMLFVLVALLIASPAMADVDITTSADVNGETAVITISYARDAEAIRAIALDITLDGDAVITDVNCVNGDFTIYPGSISIAGDGSISDAGSCECDDSYAGTLGGTGTTGVTVEMGSLYVGAANAPATSGDIVEITIEGNDDVNVCVVQNAIRGGVVLEDPDVTPTVNVGCTIVPLAPGTCMLPTHPDYAEWGAVGQPDCWCYPRQAYGDADGLQEYGVYWVLLNDLEIFKTYFQATGIGAGSPGLCADFAHDIEYGVYRVLLNDLEIFKTYFQATSVPCDDDGGDCDLTGDTRYAFWATP